MVEPALMLTDAVVWDQAAILDKNRIKDKTRNPRGARSRTPDRLDGPSCLQMFFMGLLSGGGLRLHGSFGLIPYQCRKLFV
jgi:hypothetical protein